MYSASDEIQYRHICITPFAEQPTDSSPSEAPFVNARQAILRCDSYILHTNAPMREAEPRS
jgi:hypothetical protein